MRCLWLPVIAWLIALYATLGLSDEAQRPKDAALLITAALFVVFAWPRSMQPVTMVSEIAQRPRVRLHLRLGAIATSAALSFFASLVFLAQTDVPFGAAGWLWISSILLGLATRGWEVGAARVLLARRITPVRKSELLLLVIIVGVAAWLRLWHLADFPFAVHDDERQTGNLAGQVFGTGGHTSVFTTIWDQVNLPALWFFFVDISLRLGGHTLAAVRLPTALVGVAATIPIYALIREISGRAAAGAGAALLSVTVSQIHYSRVTDNNITTSFFWAACIYFLLRSLRTRHALDWVLAGAAGGFSEYGFYGTRLLSLILLSWIIYMVIVHREQARRFVPGFGLLGLGYVTATGPLLSWFISHPTLYFGRGQSEMVWDHVPRSIHELQLMASVLWGAASRDLLAMSTIGDASPLFAAPLLAPVEAALLVLGTGLLIARWKHPEAFLLLLMGMGPLIVGGVLVGPAPQLQHWTPACPAIFAAIAFPIGEWVACAGGHTRRVLRAGGVIALGVGISALAWTNAEFYFRELSGK